LQGFAEAAIVEHQEVLNRRDNIPLWRIRLFQYHCLVTTLGGPLEREARRKSDALLEIRRHYRVEAHIVLLEVSPMTKDLQERFHRVEVTLLGENPPTVKPSL